MTITVQESGVRNQNTNDPGCSEGLNPLAVNIMGKEQTTRNDLKFALFSSKEYI